MFTGIVEEMGAVISLEKTLAGTRMTLLASTVMGDLKIGDSVSVNGICLTAISKSESSFAVEVEQILERKSHPVVRDASVAPTQDMHERLLDLEARGEIILQRVPEPYVEFTTKYGRMKKIPIEHTWHHKSCGHCGHIPGYASSILWLHRQFKLDYNDPTDQTSCTGWNYYASGASNAVGQAAVMSRNFAAAYETGYFPMIHCGTSFGHYKEIREQLVHHQELRDEVRRILDKMGKPLVIPEEIVHYILGLVFPPLKFPGVEG